MELKTLEEIKYEAIQERFTLMGENAVACAKSLKMAYPTLIKMIQIGRIKRSEVSPFNRNKHKRTIPIREELLSLDKLIAKPLEEIKKAPRKDDDQVIDSARHIPHDYGAAWKRWEDSKSSENDTIRVKKTKNKMFKDPWDDPDYDCGYHDPTPEERDKYYNADWDRGWYVERPR